MTTEILRNMLLTGDQLEDLAAVIVDEIHFLDDKERGTTWEEVLIYLPKTVQIVGLSATLANLHEFAEWLRAVRQGPVQVVEEYTRAVPLAFRIATREAKLLSPRQMKTFYIDWQRKNKGRSQHGGQRGRQRGRQRGGQRRSRRVGENCSHLDIFHMVDRDELYPYLYFVFSRRQTEQLARGLCNEVVRHYRRGLLGYMEREEMEDAISLFCEDENAAAALTHDLADMYRLGIAFHHAGLNVLLKGFVESLYERKLIKALYCTGTFALGINMPARTACFDGLERYDGRGMIPLPTREFMQMAGRAGRRGMDEEGLVIIRTTLDDYNQIAPQLQGYLASDYEPVRSNFSLSFNSVVNLLDRLPPDRIRELVEKSFLSFFRERRAEQQSAQADELEAELRDAGWTGEHAGKPAIRRQIKQLRRLKRRADSSRELTWSEFEAKVQFLVDIGYLSPDSLEFQLGARVLKDLQIQEVFTTEMVLGGIFEELSPAMLFGVLCGMVAELPRGVSVPASRQHKRLGREIANVRESDVVVSAEQLSGLQAGWDHQLIPIGKWWAEGRALSEITYNISTPTDISGSLVGAFRRAKDLAGQLRDVWRDDKPRAEMLTELIRSVSRDEVEVVG
jgi:superfamily II RNA helicase